ELPGLFLLFAAGRMFQLFLQLLEFALKSTKSGGAGGRRISCSMSIPAVGAHRSALARSRAGLGGFGGLVSAKCILFPHQLALRFAARAFFRSGVHHASQGEKKRENKCFHEGSPHMVPSLSYPK